MWVRSNVSFESKADRGYALLEPGALAAVKATRLALAPAMSAEQAFQAIAVNCLTHSTASGGNPGGVNDRDCTRARRSAARRSVA